MRKAMLSTLMVMMVSGTGMVTPASAGTQTPALRAGEAVEFSYTAPETSDEGDHVTWRWTLKNTSNAPVSNIVVTQNLSPWVPPTQVSAPPAMWKGRQSSAGGPPSGQASKPRVSSRPTCPQIWLTPSRSTVESPGRRPADQTAQPTPHRAQPIQRTGRHTFRLRQVSPVCPKCGCETLNKRRLSMRPDASGEPNRRRAPMTWSVTQA